MPGDFGFSQSSLLGFLYVLARVSGAFAFVPMPGMSAGPAPARIVLVLALSFALRPLWAPAAASEPPGASLVVGLLVDAAIGITIGLVVSFVSEAFLLAFQMLGLQAGYTFASTIDPTTQADSSLMQIFGQLAAGLLFFALNLHHDVLRAFAGSLRTHPPGSFALGAKGLSAVAGLGSSIFATGLKLALPVLAMVVMIDLALALMARINAHLQLLTVAFPLKMLATLALLSWVLIQMPRVYQNLATGMLKALQGVVGF